MTDFTPNHKEIGIMGDTHGDLQWVIKMIEVFHKNNINVILHLGDFGVWPNNEKYLIRINQKLTAYNMIMIVTLGNHENYTRMERAIPSDAHPGFEILTGYEQILFATRGQRWEWEGVSFCSLGGANSIDRFYRTPNISWWEGEQITMGDVYRTIEGGPADVMITHDAPEGVPIVEALEMRYGRSDWSIEALDYAQESRVMLRQATNVVRPELLLHGHYHIDVELDVTLEGVDDSGNPIDYAMKSICFDKEGSWANVGVLELPSKTVRTIAKKNLNLSV